MPQALGPNQELLRVPQVFHRAVSFYRQQRPREARDLCQQILRVMPDHFNALHLLGVIEIQRHNHAEGVELLRHALRVDPHSAEALYNLGVGLASLKDLEKAVESYDHALAIDPQAPVVLMNRGFVLGTSGRHAEAIASYDRALALSPRLPGAWNNRGAALAKLDRDVEAVASCERALGVKPDYADAVFDRGNALERLGRYEEALSSYERALAIDPKRVSALSKRGILLAMFNRHFEALASYDVALSIDPKNVDARWNKALALLTMGQFSSGWREIAWLWHAKDWVSHQRPFVQEVWLGHDELAGRTILFHVEQGFGDAIMAVRYVPRVAAAGARVILETPAALEPVFAHIEGVSRIIVRGGPLPPFDLHCPLLALPIAFHTTLETIPAKVPYLRASQDRLVVWQRRLGERTRPRIGITWSENPSYRNNRTRSIDLRQLCAIRTPQLELISLQKELRSEDTEVLQDQDIPHFGDEIGDFADTAALVSLMDLVVSVDTSTAHLAGAMGHPVWILLPFSPDWRWQLDREDTPWYPTARLFRQPAFGDWTSVIAKVARELTARYAEAS